MIGNSRGVPLPPRAAAHVQGLHNPREVSNAGCHDGFDHRPHVGRITLRLTEGVRTSQLAIVSFTEGKPYRMSKTLIRRDLPACAASASGQARAATTYIPRISAQRRLIHAGG